ncbi:hypothetical protein HELRODRAFT_168528 [Helobdella robusta]|uniref:Uncharacterized protein n=1 Tax=Helobdella robusta TaxID=6412 RepID=T1F0P0_HELRO|nr:hypothetical protein HELRODRAFT_168528 [Helobdella robusta]ESO09531.1 hypothetical protein HELRODRAFT_168528 [Helobdella robusta]
MVSPSENVSKQSVSWECSRISTLFLLVCYLTMHEHCTAQVLHEASTLADDEKESSSSFHTVLSISQSPSPSAAAVTITTPSATRDDYIDDDDDDANDGATIGSVYGDGYVDNVSIHFISTLDSDATNLNNAHHLEAPTSLAATSTVSASLTSTSSPSTSLPSTSSAFDHMKTSTKSSKATKTLSTVIQYAASDSSDSSGEDDDDSSWEQNDSSASSSQSSFAFFSASSSSSQSSCSDSSDAYFTPFDQLLNDDNPKNNSKRMEEEKEKVVEYVCDVIEGLNDLCSVITTTVRPLMAVLTELSKSPSHLKGPPHSRSQSISSLDLSSSCRSTDSSE